ncbi:hypothetical protein E3N88_25211 [Mikania micrantha]|uniref:Uncharacterized protein n=1 Tax=Mikania micrantha TaxID=192012 RepID=A0A5N6N5G6_9ASTR|nr:hypothetical protein E3N88_25211 [Mikania micrantha]
MPFMAEIPIQRSFTASFLEYDELIKLLFLFVVFELSFSQQNPRFDNDQKTSFQQQMSYLNMLMATRIQQMLSGHEDMKFQMPNFRVICIIECMEFDSIRFGISKLAGIRS